MSLKVKFTSNNAGVPITNGDTTQYTSVNSPHITEFTNVTPPQDYEIGTGANVNDKVIIVSVIEE